MNRLLSHNPASSHPNFNSLKNNLKGNPNSISIICLNIRSMRKNFNNFQAEISEIIDQIDIIVLNETNITDHETNIYKLKNFNSEYLNRPNRRGGGIAVFISSRFSYEILKSKEKSFEYITINLFLNNFKIPVICVYRPPGTCSFTHDFEKFLGDLPKCSDMIVVGDMNIDLFQRNACVDDYLDMMSANGLLNCNSSETTREDLVRNTKTNIDHIFVRPRNIHAIDTRIVKTLISDHF